MSNFSHWRGWWIACLVGLAGLRAAPGAEEFRLTRQVRSVSERGEVMALAWQSGTNRFSFLPPAGWLVRSDAASRTVSLTTQDLGTRMTIRIATNPAPVSSRQLAAMVLAREPGSKVLREFECYCLGKRVRAIDLERVGAEGLRASIRTAFIPTPTLWLEVRMAGASRGFERSHQAFGALLGSLRCENSSRVAAPERLRSGEAGVSLPKPADRRAESSRE